MMYVNHIPAPLLPRVNLSELAEVRAQHLPTPLVRLCCLKQLRRRAAELAREQPRLSEEAAFVLAEETTRRARLAGSPLTLSA